MPAIITHFLSAEKVLEKAKEERAVIEFDGFCLDSFMLGAQGADFFYFYKPLSKNKEMYKRGSRFHLARVFEFFQLTAEYLTRLDESSFAFKICKSYMLGYVTHYSLDKTAHPFVYSVESRVRSDLEKRNAPKRIQNSAIHELIEADIDVFMMREVKGQAVNRFKFFKKLMRHSGRNKPKLRAIADMYVAMLEQIFNDSVKQRDIIKAFKDIRKWNRRIYDRFYLKRKVISRLERLFKSRHKFSYLIRRKSPNYSFFNLYNSGWNSEYANLVQQNGTTLLIGDSQQENLSAIENSPEKVGEQKVINSKDSFKQLFDKATALSVKLAQKYSLAVFGATPLDRADFGKSFLSGLKC
ncbi:MAG: zinc dependent phospholipase C family protein [Firmicutes bacterium]|nr:zinc dependent phospholipase C family protein [Bacillota bacterium]